MKTLRQATPVSLTQGPGGRQGGAMIVRPGYIGPDARRAMFALFSQYFENARFARFLSDLDEKQWVILVYEQGGGLLGFSTIQCFDMEFEGRQVSFIFSGDTIVDTRGWRLNALAPAFAVFVERFINEHPNSLRYWFLISKGYRTYRSLPLFFIRFFPSFCEATPPLESRLLACAARRKFGQHFNETTGIISYDIPLDYLCEPLQQVASGRDSDPHVKFFLEKNPGFTRGDELACITELSWENLSRRAMRILAAGKKYVQWHE
jgi:hypothetical protein